MAYTLPRMVEYSVPAVFAPVPLFLASNSSLKKKGVIALEDKLLGYRLYAVERIGLTVDCR